MAKPQCSYPLQINEPRAEYGAFQRVKTIKVKTRYYPNKKFPSIILSGQWLEQAGFSIGTTVEVQAFENGLKLSIENEE